MKIFPILLYQLESQTSVLRQLMLSDTHLHDHNKPAIERIGCYKESLEHSESPDFAIYLVMVDMMNNCLPTQSFICNAWA